MNGVFRCKTAPFVSANFIIQVFIPQKKKTIFVIKHDHALDGEKISLNWEEKKLLDQLGHNSVQI